MFSGTFCELEDECFFNPCLNNGTCTENSTLISSDYNCSCLEGSNEAWNHISKVLLDILLFRIHWFKLRV